MRSLFIAIFPIFSLFVFSCSVKDPEQKAPLTPEQLVQLNIDSLKSMASEGDLITRLNDNIISIHVRNLNPVDKSFSHAGIVVTRDGQKLVCNIDVNEKGLDTVRYESIDSFINPKQNFHCGLFRFKLSETEKRDFIKELDKYHQRNTHFDRLYDLKTDSLIYCSEMIARSMNRATKGRILFKDTLPPKHMLPLLYIFLGKEGLTKKQVEARNYIPIDNLYLIPECTELMRFKLKHFPGDEPQ